MGQPRSTHGCIARTMYDRQWFPLIKRFPTSPGERQEAWSNIDELRKRVLRFFRAPRFRNFEIRDYSASDSPRSSSVFMHLLPPMNLYRRVSSRNDLLNCSTDSCALPRISYSPFPARRSWSASRQDRQRRQRWIYRYPRPSSAQWINKRRGRINCATKNFFFFFRSFSTRWIDRQLWLTGSRVLILSLFDWASGEFISTCNYFQRK